MVTRQGDITADPESRKENTPVLVQAGPPKTHKPIGLNNMPICNRCEKPKPPSAFGKFGTVRDGICMTCRDELAELQKPDPTADERGECAKCGHAKAASDFEPARGGRMDSVCRDCRSLGRKPAADRPCKKCNAVKAATDFRRYAGGAFDTICLTCREAAKGNPSPAATGFGEALEAIKQTALPPGVSLPPGFGAMDSDHVNTRCALPVHAGIPVAGPDVIVYGPDTLAAITAELARPELSTESTGSPDVFDSGRKIDTLPLTLVQRIAALKAELAELEDVQNLATQAPDFLARMLDNLKAEERRVRMAIQIQSEAA